MSQEQFPFTLPTSLSLTVSAVFSSLFSPHMVAKMSSGSFRLPPHSLKYPVIMPPRILEEILISQLEPDANFSVIYCSQCVCVLRCFSCVQFFTTLWTVAYRVSLSMGFSRQEHWNSLPCPLQGNLPDPGIKPKSLMSPAVAGRFFTTETLLWRKGWLTLSRPGACAHLQCQKVGQLH